jgi:hypothetical protein
MGRFVTARRLDAPATRGAFGLVVATLFLADLVSAKGGEIVHDSVRGFTLTLPDGFQPKPELASKLNMAHAFCLMEPGRADPQAILLIEPLGGVIGRERLTPADMPAGFHGSLFVTRWQGFDVDAFEVPETVGEVAFVTYNVQIPLKSAAIQVKLTGPAARQAELKTVLGTVLNGLKGESNWIPSAAGSLGNSSHYGAVLAVMIILFVLGGLLGLWVLSRKAPKGVVLAIAVGIWLAGAAIGGVRTREARGASGALKLLGFSGAILGIVDVVRSRRPRS